jgi:hypothetical protein
MENMTPERMEKTLSKMEAVLKEIHPQLKRVTCLDVLRDYIHDAGDQCASCGAPWHSLDIDDVTQIVTLFEHLLGEA